MSHDDCMYRERYRGEEEYGRRTLAVVAIMPNALNVS